MGRAVRTQSLECTLLTLEPLNGVVGISPTHCLEPQETSHQLHLGRARTSSDTFFILVLTRLLEIRTSRVR